jgi:hypothetical protein
MTKSDAGILCAAKRDIKPSHKTWRRLRGVKVVLEFHLAQGCTKTQPGQCIHNDPQALNSFEFIAPGGGQVAVHLLDECLPVGTLQNGLHLLGQTFDFFFSFSYIFIKLIFSSYLH